MKKIAKSSLITATLLTTITLSATAFAAGAADAPKEKPGTKNCISLGWLDHSQVVDNQTILFYMKGGQIYKNTLPYVCSGLQFEGGFGFTTSLHELCNTDIIRVLRQGNACGLGNFVPYEKPGKSATGAKTPAGDAPKK